MSFAPEDAFFGTFISLSTNVYEIPFAEVRETNHHRRREQREQDDTYPQRRNNTNTQLRRKHVHYLKNMGPVRAIQPCMFCLHQKSV